MSRARGVLPDFRAPDGIRVGLAPLSTSFTELYVGMRELATLLDGSDQRTGGQV